jgi:hypothetical protein
VKASTSSPQRKLKRAGGSHSSTSPSSAKSGEKTKRLIGYWYRTPLAKTVIAQKIGVCRDTIYARWNAALWYFRDRFISSPLSDLRFIAATDVDLHDVREHPQAVANDPTLEYPPERELVVLSKRFA